MYDENQFQQLVCKIGRDLYNMNIRKLIISKYKTLQGIAMSSNKKRLLLLVFIFFCFQSLIAACNRLPEGDPANGKRWFILNRCFGCHGEDALGGDGPAITRGPVIAGTKLSFYTFRRKLRNPHSGIMPTFDESKISDKEAGEIYLWLQELKK